MKHALRHQARLAARILLSIAFAGVMTLAAAGVSSASGTSAPAAECPQVLGYVCLARADGAFELVPEGKAQSYEEGLKVVHFSNGTSLNYCVLTEQFNFNLAAGTSVKREATVFAIAPSDFCLS